MSHKAVAGKVLWQSTTLQRPAEVDKWSISFWTIINYQFKVPISFHLCYFLTCYYLQYSAARIFVRFLITRSIQKPYNIARKWPKSLQYCPKTAYFPCKSIKSRKRQFLYIQSCDLVSHVIKSTQLSIKRIMWIIL